MIDTTLLRRLSSLDQSIVQGLALLYAAVLVPKAVQAEMGRQPGRGRQRLRNLLSDNAFMEICELGDAADMELLCSEVDAGEAEAIAQADELRAVDVPAHLLIDERKAGDVALRLQLEVVRSGRLLLTLKENQVIPAVKPHLDRLVALGMHMSRSARTSILTEANEA